VKVGDLVRVKNIYKGWDCEPEPGYILCILAIGPYEGSYVTMIMQGKYCGMKNLISGRELEVISASR